MNILARVILGAFAGWIASILAGRNADMGVIAHVIIGIAGAFLGGLIFNLFGGQGVTGLNLWSLLVSVVGAIVLLLLLRPFHHNHTS